MRQNHSSSDTAPKAFKFQSIQIVQAVQCGWAHHRGLSLTEVEVLLCVAGRGKQNEPRVASAWFPQGGQEWWADYLGISYSALKKALQRLRQKSLLVDLPGSANTPRFMGVKGYGVMPEVFIECIDWTEMREPMLRSFRTEQVFSEVTSGHVEVTSRHVEVTSGHVDNAVTRAFAPHYQVGTKEEPTPLTRSDRPAGVRREVDPMRYQDPWDVPKEERPEKRKGNQPYRKPSMRLAEVFDNERFKASQSRKMLSTSWSTKQAFLTRLNELLETHTEEQVAEMIRLFFVLLEAGKVIPRAEELWRDFWSNRAQCDRMVRERERSKQPVVDGGLTVSTDHLRSYGA